MREYMIMHTKRDCVLFLAASTFLFLSMNACGGENGDEPAGK